MKKLIIILSAFVLMGMSDVERRAEQKRIEEMVNSNSDCSDSAIS